MIVWMHSPSIEIQENDETAEKTLTVVLQSVSERDGEIKEIGFRALTSTELRCLGNQLELAAGMAEENTGELARDQRFTITTRANLPDRKIRS